jgi:F-type H+-transporting ATPase subunit b
MASTDNTEAASGMPQLDFSTFSNQAFRLVLTIVGLFLMVRLLIMPKMDNILANRRKVIKEDLVGAEAFRDNAERLKESINQEIDSARIRANEIMQKSKEKVKNSFDTGMTEASEITSNLIEESEIRINAMNKSSQKEVDQISKELVPKILKKIAPELK